LFALTVSASGLLFARNSQPAKGSEPMDTGAGPSGTSGLPFGPIIPSEHPKVTLNPDQSINKKPTDKITGEPTKRVVLEIFKVNGEPFDGVLSDSDIYELWECLAGDRDVREIYQKGCKVVLTSVLLKHQSVNFSLRYSVGYEQIKGVCLRIAYNLKKEIQLTELSTKPEFSINKKGAFRTDVYRVRLPDFDRIAYTLGEEITVTLQNTLFRFSDEEMLAWVGAFGKITSPPR